MKYVPLIGLCLCLACQPNPAPESSQAFLPLHDSLSLILGTSHGMRDFSLAPDGQELFYTLVSAGGPFSAIIRRTKQGSQWGKPEIASFSGQYRDLEAAFSPDGQQVFFASNRPLSENDSTLDHNIWKAEKTAQGWGIPQVLPASINGPGEEFYPSVAENGTLYFTATRPEGLGREDIYRALWQDGTYLAPQVLDSAVNSRGFEFNAFVAPDESFLLFSSFGRPDGLGGGDLYLSQKGADGQWQPAKPLPKPYNSDRLDYCPFVSLENDLFVMSSNRFVVLPPDSVLTYPDLMIRMNSPGNGYGDLYAGKWSAVWKAITN